MTNEERDLLKQTVSDMASFMVVAVPAIEKQASLEKEAADLKQERNTLQTEITSLKNKTASDKEALSKRATQTADNMIACGLLETGKKDEFVSKIAEDPSTLLDELETVASNLSPTALGNSSSEKGASLEDAGDPLIKYLFGNNLPSDKIL